MPQVDVKLLVLISPLVNVDLFKKGLYQVKCRVKDVPCKADILGVPFVTECNILDSPNGTELKGSYPRAFVQQDNVAVTKTMYIQYIQQNYVLSEWFAFDVSIPVLSIPDFDDQSLGSLELALDLFLCETEKTFRVSPKDFSLVSSRTIVVSLNRYGSIHEYTDAIFDFVYMAAVGVNVHAAVVGFDASQGGLPLCPPPPPQSTSWFGNLFKSRQQQHQQQQAPPLVQSVPGFSDLLFDVPSSSAKAFPRSAVYETVSTRQLVSACERFERIWNVLRQTYVSLKELLQDAISYRTGGERIRVSASSSDFPVRESLADFTSIIDFTACCQRQLVQADEAIRHIWNKFSTERVTNQGLLESFVYVSHRKRISTMLNTTILLPHPADLKEFDFSAQAQKTREGLETLYGLRCRENVEENLKTSIVFVEHLSWKRYDAVNEPCVQGASESVLDSVCPKPDSPQNGMSDAVNMINGSDQVSTPPQNPSTFKVSPEILPAKEPSPLQLAKLKLSSDSQGVSSPLSPTTPDHSSFSDCTFPYLLCSITGATGREPSTEVHLVVFLHGLEGRHFDLRLYKIYLELSLPQVTFDFLLCQSMEGITFCDFDLMTDRAVEEFLKHLRTSMVQPTRISFVAHSLGSIVVRNMLTRPEMAPYLSLMHTIISLCAPHLGTTHTSSHISFGMWFLQKWHHSQSLLQLSMKDHSNLAETFLFRLSQKKTFGHFRNVLLVSSPQDKYVPFYSARLECPSEHAGGACSVMLDNILKSAREQQTRIIRFTVDHLLESSTNSLIGRAAHIAKLEDVCFVEKHSWEVMAQSALRKYPNPHNPSVYSLDVLERRVEPKEIKLCRLFSTLWNVPALVLRIIGINQATLVKELVHVDIANKSYKLRATNITFSNMVTVDETLVYTPCPEDCSKTVLVQTAKITVQNVPLLNGTLEDLMYNSLSGNASKGRMAIEEVAQRIELERS